MIEIKLGDGDIIKGFIRDGCNVYILSFEHPDEAMMTMELNKKEMNKLINKLTEEVEGLKYD